MSLLSPSTHATAASRNVDAVLEAHMRHIDVRKVREGTQQAHAAQLENLGEHVAEYATTPQTEGEETTSYVKGYLPHPVTHVDQFVGNKTDEVDMAWQLLSPLIRNLTPSARGTILQKKGKLATAAWAFSGEGFFADGNTAGDMADWARKCLPAALGEAKPNARWISRTLGGYPCRARCWRRKRRTRA